MTEVLPHMRCAFRLLLITLTQIGRRRFLPRLPALILPLSSYSSSFDKDGVLQMEGFKGGASALSHFNASDAEFSACMGSDLLILFLTQVHTLHPRLEPRSWSTRTCWCFLVGGHGRALTLCTSRRGSSMKSIPTHPPKTGKSTSGFKAQL